MACYHIKLLLLLLLLLLSCLLQPFLRLCKPKAAILSECHGVLAFALLVVVKASCLHACDKPLKVMHDSDKDSKQLSDEKLFNRLWDRRLVWKLFAILVVVM